MRVAVWSGPGVPRLVRRIHMIRRRLIFTAAAVLLALSVPGWAQSPDGERDVRARMAELEAAHRVGDTAVLERIYLPGFILTSQSGTRYERTDAIADSASGFESYANTDLVLRQYGDTMLVNYVSERKRKNVPEAGRFRVTAVWVRTDARWRMAGLQSTRIAPPAPPR